MKKQIQNERAESIKEKLQKNRENLQSQLSKAMLVISKNESLPSGGNILSSRMNRPPCKFYSPNHQPDHQVLGEEDRSKKPVRSIRMPSINRLPPYTSWIHLARNEKMTADQSVSRKRNVYYDHQEGETLVCSDSDEESNEHKEVERKFSQGEDRFIRTVFDEHGLTEEVLSIVKDVIGGTSSEIQERYKNIKEKDQNDEDRRESESQTDISLNKSLSASLDTFDHFYCRRCMIFDCPLHGCSQKIIYPFEKQPVWQEPEGPREPCGDDCYLHNKDVTISNCMRGLNLDANNEEKNDMEETKSKHLCDSIEGQAEEESTTLSDWKLLEKELYLKGIEMFGRNSCLIAKNLLFMMKTCKEVARYMHAEESMPHGSMDENGTSDAMRIDNEMTSRSRSLQRKSKSKKFKYSSKSCGLPSKWKRRRNTDEKNKLEKQYTPCECEGACGKQCPCLLNSSCCEKYCGCSKLCKNRFGGCQCTKSQCRSRHCPCFAASRDCDPDVCRNCWVSCGDGNLGESSHRGEDQCENMMLLVRKQQKILWARSDVAGWGAFLKAPANKNDFLGEYTGEVISHIEADKRGKFYDRVDFSYLFNLNDTYCLDAFRKGNKLKFANHASKANCYGKIVFVNGDHRVGIFAKEHIEAGEELFFDYGYDENSRPPWLHKLLDDGSKEDDDPTFSQGKAKKQCSR